MKQRKCEIEFQIRTLILRHVSRIWNWSWILHHVGKCMWAHSHKNHFYVSGQVSYCANYVFSWFCSQTWKPKRLISVIELGLDTLHNFQKDSKARVCIFVINCLQSLHLYICTEFRIKVFSSWFWHWVLFTIHLQSLHLYICYKLLICD